MMILREWRDREGLSAREAAELFGLSHTSVRWLERGVRSPNLTTVDLIELATEGAVTRLDWPKDTKALAALTERLRSLRRKKIGNKS